MLRCIEKVYTGQVPTRALSPRRVHRDRDRRADAGGRGRGRDGRGDRDRRAGRSVRVFTPVYPRQHVGRRGADIAAGQIVARAGDVLNPSRVGALAAIGVVDVDVFARPRVAILSTGNEIVEPGQPLGAGTDLRHQPLHARRRSSPRTAASPVACRTAPDTLDALIAPRSDARPTPTSSCSPAAARSASAI